MNEIPGMNIINKFADSLRMPVVNLNINLNIYAWSEECICIKSGKVSHGKIRERSDSCF